jgi:FAD/FMN-containing dehydrogenase
MSFLERLQAAVGAAHVLTDTPSIAPFLTDWRRRYTGSAQAVVRPATTAEVAAVVTLCAQARTPIVPQGGNTGLVGGATPDASGRAIVLSLTRLNRVREVDPVNGTITAEAGCVLQQVQQVAREAGRLFPLSLAAEGSATIGGNLSTNAGGTQVLRYGNARDLTLGVEVVLPSGETWHGLRALRKDNTGYDLRDLFIGAEGTLGVITAACLKLYPLPRGQATAILAVPSIENALQLLQLAQAAAGPALTAFEFFSDVCLRLVERHFASHRSPFAERHAGYVLAEISDHDSEQHGMATLQAIAEQALAESWARDAVIAQSGAQSRSLWSLRELISEAQALEGHNLKHDIAVPISAVGRFTAETDALLAQQFGPVRMVTFGHLGDGNLHYNISPPPGMAEDAFLALQPAVYRCVHDQVARHAGSISAEHGIGQLKRDENRRYKSAVEMAMMQAVKSALDPLGIMNPGKIL